MMHKSGATDVQRMSAMLVRHTSENEPGGDPVRKSKCDNEQGVRSREHP